MKIQQFIFLMTIISFYFSFNAYGIENELEKEKKDYHEIAEGLTWGASLRTRYEFQDDFRFQKDVARNKESFLLTQIRLNLKWEPTNWITFFVEGQDAHIFGEKAIDENATPNIFSDPFDFHQGYILFKIAQNAKVPVKIKAGRQKLAFGKQRLVGPLEWVNTARVVDALRVTLGPKERQGDFFASRLVPARPTAFNDWEITTSRTMNSQIYGLYYSDKILIPKTTTETYWIYRRENTVGDNVHTIGLRLDSKIGNWDTNAEFSGQFGKYGNINQLAFAGHLEAGYTWVNFHQTRTGLAYNIASGDKDASDNKRTTFDNLIPTNHLYYGYMDFHSLQNIHNFEANFSMNLHKKIRIRAACHSFWLFNASNDAWYNAGGGVIRGASAGASSYVGTEIDLTAQVFLWEEKLALLTGYSHYFAGGFIRDTGSSRDADYFYQQLKIIF